MGKTPERRTQPFSSILALAAPVMLGYVAIGLPSGILESKIGMSPLMALVLSASFYTGSGQFMLSNLLMAGVPAPSAIASITFVNTRQLLYSASFAPFFDGVGRLCTFLFSATVTDETFALNLLRLSDDEQEWGAWDAFLLNVTCMSSWALSNCVGALVGGVLNIPVAIASFAMTSIFVCLLVTQSHSRPTLVCSLFAALGVVACKLVGLSSPAILLGALAGIVAGTLAGEVGGR